MKELADRICDLLQGGQPAVVATILSRSGSAPRTAGSKMVVDEGGGFVGTIGGGKFEADVLEKAQKAFARGRPQKMFFDLSRNDVSAMDMICGGKVELLVDYLAPETREKPVFEAWRRTVVEPAAASLVTVVTADEVDVAKTAHCMVFADGKTVGDWPLSPVLLLRLAEGLGSDAASRVIEAENALLLVEPTLKPKTLLVFGAGHVSMPTCRLAADVGFRVVVADDRASFANRQRFAEADEILVPPDFASALEGLAVDGDTFIVIVTRGHRFDKEVLAQALRTEAGYIGMIGSRRKRDAIYAALAREGFSESDFARVHCPIGLAIGAETPAELAVSIVAELIAQRAGMSP